MSDELSLTPAEIEMVEAGLIKEFEREGVRLSRLANVHRVFGNKPQAEQIEVELLLIQRKIHYLKTSEIEEPS